jgi:succinyl-CoA synthetase beta subunit
LKLLEFQGKSFLAGQGLPIPKGIAVNNEKDMIDAFEAMGGKAVLKIQAPAGGRGKAGGVKLVDDAIQVSSFFKQWIGKDFKGTAIDTFLVQELIGFFTGVVSQHCFLIRVKQIRFLMFSTQGGVDIETVAKNQPEARNETFTRSVANLYR